MAHFRSGWVLNEEGQAPAFSIDRPDRPETDPDLGDEFELRVAPGGVLEAPVHCRTELLILSLARRGTSRIS